MQGHVKVFHANPSLPFEPDCQHCPFPCAPRHSPTADNQVIKLPIDKFTVREREMLIGSGILPPEFFHAAKNPFVIGLGGRKCVRVSARATECFWGQNSTWVPVKECLAGWGRLKGLIGKGSREGVCSRCSVHGLGASGVTVHGSV